MSISALLIMPKPLTVWITINCGKFGKLSSGHRTGKVSFHSNPKERQSQRMFKVPHNCAHLTLQQLILKILQSKLQQYVNHELPDVQAGFRKGRGIRDQMANIRWIIEKARELQRNIYFCFIDYTKAFDCVDHNTVENSSRDGNTRAADLPPEKSVSRSRSNSQNWTRNRLVPNCGRSMSGLYIVTLLI